MAYYCKSDMEEHEVVGVAQTSFNGATHLIDKDGNTFCGTVGGDGQLFNDDYPAHLDVVTCKRCLKKAGWEIINKA